MAGKRVRRRFDPRREGNTRYAFSFRLREQKKPTRFSLYANENGTFIAVAEGHDFADCYAKAMSHAETVLKNFPEYVLYSVQST